MAVAGDEDPTVDVRVSVQNWSLRPQGYCGEVYAQCGFLVFLVDGQEVTRSASLTTSVPFGSLGSVEGEHRIRVELRGDDDVVALDAEGEPLAAEIGVTVAESCP